MNFFPSSFLPIIQAGTIILVLSVFLVFIYLAVESWAYSFDLSLDKLFVKHRTKNETRFMRGLSWLGGPYGISLTVFIFSAWLFVHRFGKEVFLFILMVALALIYVLFLKLLIVRKRPTLRVLEREHTYSFPSAHSLLSSMVYLIVAGSIYGSFRGSQIVSFSLVVLIFAIGTSRLYLGVHYLSDVLAGIFSGIIWAIIFLYFH